MFNVHPEQYYSIAFLVITFLNLMGVAALIASKSLRGRRNQASERLVHTLIQQLGQYETPARKSKEAEKLVRNISLSELRQLSEKCRRDRQPQLEWLSRLLREVNRVEELVSAARNGNKWKKLDALVILGHLRLSEGFLVLRNSLRASDPDVVYAAVAGLAAWDSTQSIELLVSLIGRDVPINASRVATAIETSSADILKSLIRKAEGTDPIAQFWAANLLQKYPVLDSRRILQELARSANANVRAAAAVSLGKMGDESSDRALISLLGDSEWFVRGQAARASGERRLLFALPFLTPLLGDAVWWVRSDAREAIERIGPAAIDHLIPLLESTDRFVRNMAAEALENMGFVDAAIWDLQRQNGEKEKAIRVLKLIRHAEGSPTLAEKIHRLDPLLLESLAPQLQLAAVR